MNELIEALLQFSRLGRTAERKEDVDMERLVQGLVAELLADRDTNRRHGGRRSGWPAPTTN
jgi:hypothetical protein